MKVSDYVPRLYENNIEMTNIISTEEVEFENNLKPFVDNCFNDTIPIKATEKGISQYEKILNIIANPTDESLEFRRERIINRLISRIPFTEKYLIDYLDNLLGKDNWSYTINYSTYTLIIRSLIPGRLWYNELVLFLNNIVPVNIDWTIQLFTASWDAVNSHFSTWNSIYTEEMTWQDILDGEWST